MLKWCCEVSVTFLWMHEIDVKKLGITWHLLTSESSQVPFPNQKNQLARL